ncbi:MAG: erythromycin esterase family protein [Gemmatimonadaceae bacterium]
MTARMTSSLVSLVRGAARPLAGSDADWDALLDRVGNARFVLVGEASHGTHEFYRIRADVTRLLIERKGFTAVAVEADWPDAHCVNRYVRGRGRDPGAVEALAGFQRFPQWMWRNDVVVDFVEWLRAHNARLGPAGSPAGFYGIDLYSLHASIQSVLAYLAKVDPEAARRARERYACFDHHGADPQAYGYGAALDLEASCEEEVVRQLVELRRQAFDLAQRDGPAAKDDFFSAEQNARVVANAERYYRSMFARRVSSWNLRDTHMAETLDELERHLGAGGTPPRIVVWAHNSHLGDARATQMGRGGELNVGQLVRDRHGADAVLVGFTTHTGTVTAADDWDEPARRKRVRPSLPGSWERLFHETGVPAFYLDLHESETLADAMSETMLERAIGVIYRPETERWSHYSDAELSAQFDAVIHLDETRALHPLERTPRWEHDEPAETYPTGI